MSTTVTVTPAEPEAVLESSLCTILSAASSLFVDGALAPSNNGTVKRLASDSFISVKVDLSSQDLDLATTAAFITLSADVTVCVASADDPEGRVFRDECSAVRAALISLTGDNCDRLSSDELAIDSFMLVSTSTSFEPGDNPTSTKTYTATVKGRVIKKEGATNG